MERERAMSDPVNEFCDAIATLSEEDRYNVVAYCCMATGREQDPTGVPPDSDVPLKQIFCDLTVEDLRAHLTYLVREIGMMEDFLLPSLLKHLIETFEGFS